MCKWCELVIALVILIFAFFLRVFSLWALSPLRLLCPCSAHIFDMVLLFVFRLWAPFWLKTLILPGYRTMGPLTI